MKIKIQINGRFKISKEMIIGLHNTFSGLKPEKFWLAPFNFIAKCQYKDAEKTLGSLLYDGYDICIDLRIYFKYNLPLMSQTDYEVCIAHGAMSYKTPKDFIFDTLDRLSYTAKGLNRKVYVRVILEKETNLVLDKLCFSKFCFNLKRNHPDIIFYGGVFKPTWERLYDFKNNLEVDTVQYVGSMAENARWYEKFIPYLYARRKNLDNLKNVTDESKIYLFDFFDNVYSKNKS